MADMQEHEFNTGTGDASIVVGTYGNAKGTRDQFKNSKPELLDPVHTELAATSTFAGSHVAGSLQKIITDMSDAWGGENADNAIGILKVLHTDAGTISTTASTMAQSIATFQTSWKNIKAAAEKLGDDDNSQAHSLFKQFCDAQDNARKVWPNTLYYHDPLSENSFTPPGGPAGGPAGPGGGPGNLPGHYPGGPAGIGNHPGNYPGSPGHPSNYPGNYPGGPSGIPGNVPGHYPGSGPGGYPGATIDTHSHLAGLDSGAAGGPAGGIGGGPGLSAGGVGAGGVGAGGVGAGGAPGAGVGGAPGAGIVAGGPGGAVAAGPGRGMMAPGHGGGGDEEERDRSTWLTEDEDLWDGDDAPPGVIR